ncbi:thioesterase [Oceanobacillus caeni]|uniref:Acyl-ACP thioesterase n=1 Tax=Oceanobacillus caeni TaxID=405946 RepID=A0ABR5MLJ6_9BACI|nr:MULTISPECIES: acyl-ACP thioesterase domain-containing protein [Bacillaceae]KKE79711.1 acyl-ACP thioesterase [Bacilli bacterium VT-13-104]PZD89574.1 acyl-ACP thioesterase [Bacilli bacterium]KPH76659.1 acyl-ACP thioesterase [Oceanobacillus caeni]MBU8789189.1 acyl-ACP thioesterase [Oceanobacillus caeni]MCR1833328.1 thioesterase [Oceanobacillus caeni]
MSESLFTSKYHIDLRDVDFKKELKWSALFSYFQEIASLAASDLGLGIDTLQKGNGLAWVLTKIRVDVDRLPSWGEEIIIETWPLEPGKLNFDRDYIVRDQDGKSIIRAISSWVIIDLKERKLKRSKSIPFSFPTPKVDRAMKDTFSKLKHNEQVETVYTKTIGYSDVDFNGHLNNSKYIDYIMDCFDINDHKKYDVMSIEVNFIHEALPGESILLKKDVTLHDNQVYVEGINEKNNRIVFKAKLKVVKP